MFVNRQFPCISLLVSRKIKCITDDILNGTTVLFQYFNECLQFRLHVEWHFPISLPSQLQIMTTWKSNVLLKVAVKTVKTARFRAEL